MNIGLVLSGGMAKGAYQVGALRALNNYIPINEIKCISGASVGVLNGYAYITDQLDNLQEMWRDLCCDDSRYYVNQILKSSILQRDIKNICTGTQTLNSDFYCSLFDIKNKYIAYKNIAKVDPQYVLPYLKASVAMPIYNKAISIEDGSFYDGAMVDNIPVFPLLEHNLDYLICIYFDDVCYKFESECFDNKIIKITFPRESILRQSLVFNSENINNMIASGYEKTNCLLKEIFRNGYEDLEYIYNFIGNMNGSKENSFRITGDVLVTNLNRITQKFSKRLVL